jgi:hypothetical protein
LTEINTGLGWKMEEDLPSQCTPKIKSSNNNYIRKVDFKLTFIKRKDASY